MGRVRHQFFEIFQNMFLLLDRWRGQPQNRRGHKFGFGGASFGIERILLWCSGLQDARGNYYKMGVGEGLKTSQEAWGKGLFEELFVLLLS